MGMGCSPTQDASPYEVTATATVTAEAATAAPTYAPTPTPALTQEPGASTNTPEPILETTEGTGISDSDVLGEINVEYPIKMSPGSSDSVIISIYIPDKLVSLVPMAIERIDIPPDVPPIIGELSSYQSTILVREIMRVELSSPTFEIESQYPSTQLVNINAIAEPTFWAWTIVAPNATGAHVLTIRVYLGDNDSPSWVGSLEIEVTEFTPTPIPTPMPTDTPTSTNTPTFTPTNTPTGTPTSTNTPTNTPVPTNTPTSTPTPTITPTSTPVPFIDRPGGVATIGAMSLIIVAIIGLIGTLAAKKIFLPIISPTRRKENLKREMVGLERRLQSLKEKKAKLGFSADSSLDLEIEDIEAKLEELQIKLKQLEDVETTASLQKK